MKKRIEHYMTVTICLLLVTVLIISGCGSKDDSAREADSEDFFSNNSDSQLLENPREEAKTEHSSPSTADENDEGFFTGSDSEKGLTYFGERGKEESFTMDDYDMSILNPLSTFSVDVDTAGYAIVRNSLKNGYLPSYGDIRIEEMVNYFDYNYERPTNTPFKIITELGECPWNEEYVIASIALNGMDVDLDDREPTNLVFLLDVSGSMNDEDKLPLLKESFKMLVNELNEDDRVSIVVYAGASGVILEGARGDDKREILRAIDRLEAGGSTAGSEGIQLAYEIARDYYIRNGNNRVILATDGDFNVGLTSERELLRFIEKKREEGIFLSALGFGENGRNFDTMELLADNGNGHFAYIDSEKEAKKVLTEELGGTLYTIAKDVKIQVEFNPTVVQEYALIGYDNRRLEDHEFDDDRVDAGDIGAGHQVTALYMLRLTDGVTGSTSGLRYQKTTTVKRTIDDEVMYVKLRYKEPDSDRSRLVEGIVYNEISRRPSDDFGFACAVAEFGLALRGEFDYDSGDYDDLHDLALDYVIDDPDAYKIEFIELISRAADLQ